MANSENSVGDVSHHRGHSPKYWIGFGLLVLIAAAIILFVGILPRQHVRADINKEAKDRVDERPKIQVLKVQQSPASSTLEMPGTTLAYTEAYIYARASGYLKERLVDIGDHVRRGQLMAVIDAPDLDKQIAQGRSALQQSLSSLDQLKSQLVLQKANWDRYKVLVAKGVFSKQEGDQQEANFQSADANVRAAQDTVQGNRDNLERLLLLQGYERVTAPFSGVVTARNTDVGALISTQGTGLAGNSSPVGGTTQSGAQGTNGGSSGLSSSVSPATGSSQGGQMFTIAAVDPLRVMVAVPEVYTSLVHVGQKADLNFQALAGEKVQGTVTRTSASIDQNTRTLLVEVQARNPTGKLLPGMYVVANFVNIKAVPPLMVPGESVVIRDGKTAVAVVADNKVHFRPVVLGRDFGEQTEVVSGLNVGDVVVKNVSDEVQEGVEIQPVYPKQQGGQNKGSGTKKGQ